MTPTKILFLDIDGVLNSNRTSVAFNGFPHSFAPADLKRFDNVAIALIRRLCEETDTAIVLSSDWRFTNTAHETANALDLPVIDVTPKLTAPRGFEIQKWLNAHPEVKTYAIVDDNDLMFETHSNRFIKTDPDVGLTLRNYLDLLQLLRAAVLNFEDEEVA